MKRDMDKVRELLLRIEGGDSDVRTQRDTEESHHLWLLQDAGFIDSGMIDEWPVRTTGGEWWPGLRLTWDGAEFLDGIREDSMWAKVKDTIQAKGGQVAFETVKLVVADLAKQMFSA